MTAAPARTWLVPGAVFLYAVLLFGWMHTQGGLREPEGYYHARVANLLPAHGLTRTFEWTQASAWKDRWSDGDFLYHLLMAPFAQGAEPIRGALVLSTLLSAGVFLGFHLFLRAARVPAPWLGTALLFCMGGPFLLRLSFVRPQSLSVLCLIAALHFLVRRDWKALAAAALAFAWRDYYDPETVRAVRDWAARWMAENLEPGETVVNLWGDDFPDLFYDGHRQRLLVGEIGADLSDRG